MPAVVRAIPAAARVTREARQQPQRQQDGAAVRAMGMWITMATDIATTGHPAAVTAVITAAVMAADTTDKR